jgi:hypothetical protein
VFRGDITRFEDVMAGKHKSERAVNFREVKERENDAQDGYVTEENAYEQRAYCGGYHGAVHAPRRWLLEDTRPSGARRE